MNGQLEERDEVLVRNALQMWANHIETGTVTLSAKDAKAVGKPFKALDSYQMKMVIRLRELADKFDL